MIQIGKPSLFHHKRRHRTAESIAQARAPGDVMVWMSDNQIAVLIQEWERARAGAEEFIDSMPDDKVSFRPVPEVLSFAGQFLHVAGTNYTFAAGAFGTENPFQGAKPEDDPARQSKTALLEFALASYEFIVQGLRSLTPDSLEEEVPFFRWTMSRRLILAKALEHHAHHRGQTVVYFRLQGMKPPSERLF
jgi:uncharacterized damage-inducible protein DinB